LLYFKLTRAGNLETAWLREMIDIN
jgi:hypothetical protein